MATKASEYGGGPGQFDGRPSTELVSPHLERQALTQVTGGKVLVTDAAGKPITEPPAYGAGGVQIA